MMQVNTLQLPHYLLTLKDKLTVTYVGRGSHMDVGCVRSCAPCPSSCRAFYFEVEIQTCESFPKICVGLTSKHTLPNKPPGVDDNTFSYRSDDGRKLIGPQTSFSAPSPFASTASGARGEQYGPAYGKGDIVGCCVHFVQKCIFFTLNGKKLNDACPLETMEDLYPCLSLAASGEKAKFIFGGPFKFDFTLMLQEELSAERERLRWVRSRADLRAVTQAYLLHGGFHLTLQAMDGRAATNSSFSTTSSSCSSFATVSSAKTSSASTITRISPMPFGNANSSSSFSGSDIAASSMKVETPLSEEERGPGVQPTGSSSHIRRHGTSGGGDNQICTFPDFLDEGWEKVRFSAIVEKRLEATLAIRKSLRDHVLAGEVTAALEELDKYFPDIARCKTPLLALALLVSQQLIECLRVGDLSGAVRWTRSRLAKLPGVWTRRREGEHTKEVEIIEEKMEEDEKDNKNEDVSKVVMESCALLAYKRPEESALVHLFDVSRRTLTAEKLNEVLLGRALNVCEWSPLHVAIRQLVACKQLLRERSGHGGPIPDARQFCYPVVRAATTKPPTVEESTEKCWKKETCDPNLTCII